MFKILNSNISIFYSFYFESSFRLTETLSRRFRNLSRRFKKFSETTPLPNTVSPGNSCITIVHMYYTVYIFMYHYWHTMTH